MPLECEPHKGRSPLTLFTNYLQHPVHEKCSVISREWISGSHKVVAPPTPVSSGHLQFQCWWWEEAEKKDRHRPLVLIDENECFLFNQEWKHRRAQDLVWACRSRWWQDERLKLLYSWHLPGWFLHMYLIAISTVLFHNGIQRMRINSIPRELLLEHLVTWHVGIWLMNKCSNDDMSKHHWPVRQSWDPLA